MTTKTLSHQQITRAQRAADQRNDYTCRTLAGPGTTCVEVRKVKDGTTYLVWLGAGMPACSCEDHGRNPQFVCKHGVLSLIHLREENTDRMIADAIAGLRNEEPEAAPAEEPAPATISDEEWEAWQESWEKEEQVRNWEAGRCHWCCCEPCTCPADYPESETELTFSLVSGEWVETPAGTHARALAERAVLWA